MIKRLLVLLVLFLAGTASAMTVTVNGVNITLNYDEPTTNENALALQDLDHTTCYYDMGNGYVKTVDVPATSATGGGHITTDITVPVMAGQEVDVKFKTTATDSSGNESIDSSIITKRIDRLAPAAPK